jgi:D-alanyl-D-alanine carboxypeptidase
MRPSIRAAVVALLLGTVLLAAPATQPLPVAGVGPLPDCRLDDILTEPRGYDDWAITQVDWILGVGKDYKPPDLVSVYNAGVTGGGLIRRVAFDDLKAMAAAAKKAGAPLGNVSSYRSYKQQVKLFDGYARGYGFKKAVTFSARPGHSEHQLGLVIDFAAAGSTKFTNESAPAGKWLSRNAWKYGWLMSYPDGKSDAVCYSYEPWHYRYVGRDLAEKIHDSGLTIREYLWANYTQVDPACVALPPPKLVTPGTARSCAFAVASPSPAATTTPTGLSSPPPATSPVIPVVTPPPATAPTAASGIEPAMAIGGFVLLALAAVAFVAWWQGRARQSRRRP